MTDVGDYVLDPYMGSGSTAVAALRHGRNCVGAEANADYVAIWQERLRRLERGELATRPMGRPIHGTAA